MSSIEFISAAIATTQFSVKMSITSTSSSDVGEGLVASILAVRSDTLFSWCTKGLYSWNKEQEPYSTLQPQKQRWLSTLIVGNPG